VVKVKFGVRVLLVELLEVLVLCVRIFKLVRAIAMGSMILGSWVAIFTTPEKVEYYATQAFLRNLTVIPAALSL